MIHCPVESCWSTNSAVKKTKGLGNPDQELPKRLRGQNIIYRIRQCLDCKTTFATVEMAETDLINLRRPPGRLETENVRVRP